MKIYEELVARGLIAQVTNEEEIKNMINEGKATSTSALTVRRIALLQVTLWLLHS